MLGTLVGVSVGGSIAFQFAELGRKNDILYKKRMEHYENLVGYLHDLLTSASIAIVQAKQLALDHESEEFSQRDFQSLVRPIENHIAKAKGMGDMYKYTVFMSKIVYDNLINSAKAAL